MLRDSEAPLVYVYDEKEAEWFREVNYTEWA